jgi:hypothetical protein
MLMSGRAAKGKNAGRSPIQLAISFVTVAPAAEDTDPRVPFVATDEDLPAIFFDEIKVIDGPKAPAGGSENLGGAEAVTD